MENPGMTAVHALDTLIDFEVSLGSRVASEVFHVTVSDGRVVTPVGEFTCHPGASVRAFQEHAKDQSVAALHAFQSAMQAVIGIH